MAAKAVRWLLGILLIPACVGYSQVFYAQLAGTRRVGDPGLSILLGITAYLAYHVLVAPPSRMYVLGHEITHAAAAWVSGGEVKGIKVGAKSGSVKTNKVTGLIALAPYLVPVWAVLWSLAYGAAGLLWKGTAAWMSWFFFGLGAALAFHLVFTVDALKQKQTDLEVWGPALSLALIYWMNLAWVVGIMALVAPEIRFTEYLAQGFRQSRGLYTAIFTQLFIR